MSHISKAKVKVELKDKNLLEKSLLSLKDVRILKNEYLYRETGVTRVKDTTSGIFDYVIQSKKDHTLRVGLRKNRKTDTFEVYYDNYGKTGEFAKPIVNKLNDWYVGYLTAETIKQSAQQEYSDFNIDVFEDEETGEIVVEAQEKLW